MRTATIKQPRKDGPQAVPSIESFVQGPADAGDVVKLSVRLPEELHRRMKISVAAAKGDSIQDRIVRLIEADLAAEDAQRQSGKAA